MLESIAIMLTASLCFGFGVLMGRRMSHPDARVEKLASSVSVHAADIADLKLSISVIDEYLQKQSRQRDAKETEMLGRLSQEVRAHLNGKPPPPDEEDDAVRPTTHAESL